jgi:hypothetical protein
MIISQIKHAALVVIISNLLLASVSMAGENPASKPFQSLDKRVSQVEAVVPPLTEGIRALLNFTAPEQIVMPSAQPCPEGYERSIFGSASICVLSPEPPPPPPAPKGCEDGYVLKETLPDGSPVPAHLVICERIGGNSATVSITYRGVRSELQSLTAQCPESFVVTGGGYSSLDVDPVGQTGSVSKNFLVYSSRPQSPDQWSISVKFPDAGFHDVTAYALCIYEPAT